MGAATVRARSIPEIVHAYGRFLCLPTHHSLSSVRIDRCIVGTPSLRVTSFHSRFFRARIDHYKSTVPCFPSHAFLSVQTTRHNIYRYRSPPLIVEIRRFVSRLMKRSVIAGRASSQPHQSLRHCTSINVFTGPRSRPLKRPHSTGNIKMGLSGLN